MTILKSAADEILETMAKEMGIKVNASDVDDFKRDLANAKTEAEVDAAYDKHRYALKRSMSPQDWPMLVNMRKNQIKKSQKADDELDQSAIDQAIDHLISAADAFDKGGLESAAGLVDKMLEKIAKNKTMGGKNND